MKTEMLPVDGLDVDVGWVDYDPTDWRNHPDPDDNENEDDEDIPTPEYVKAITGIDPDVDWVDDEPQEKQIPFRWVKATDSDPIRIHLPLIQQEDKFSCGPCCATSILMGLSGRNSWYENEVAKEAGTTEAGTTPEDLAAVINELGKEDGITAEVVSGMDLDQLEQEVQSGCPVIVNFQAWADGEPDYTQLRDGHYAVAVGVDAVSIWFMDPSLEDVYGKLGRKEFNDRWYDRRVDGKTTDHLGIVVRVSEPDAEAVKHQRRRWLKASHLNKILRWQKAGEWSEEAHPRDEHGKFSSGGGESDGGPEPVRYHGTTRNIAMNKVLKDGLQRGDKWQDREPSVYFSPSLERARTYARNRGGNRHGAIVEFDLPPEHQKEAKKDEVDSDQAYRVERDIPPERIRAVWVLEEDGTFEGKMTRHVNPHYKPLKSLAGKLYSAIVLDYDEDETEKHVRSRWLKAGEWSEEQHARDERGRFSSTGGAGELPKEVQEHLGKTLDSVLKHTGYTKDQIRDALNGPANASHGENAKIRARVTGSILLGGTAVPNAVTHVLDHHNKHAAEDHIEKIGTGDVDRLKKELGGVPLYDLQIIGGLEWKSTPVAGQATCQLATRKLTMGKGCPTGDARHELGHAMLSAWCGETYQGKTQVSKAVAAEYDKVKAKAKANPAGTKTKLDHEWYELNYGIAGKRGLDSWHENAAEQYRLYHKRLYQDRNEGGGGKMLAQYNERHPGWAEIFNAHYSTSLLAMHLKAEGKQ